MAHKSLTDIDRAALHRAGLDTAALWSSDMTDSGSGRNTVDEHEKNNSTEPIEVALRNGIHRRRTCLDDGADGDPAGSDARVVDNKPPRVTERFN